MLSFVLEQKVNLQEPNDIRKYNYVPLKFGDTMAHEWKVTVVNGSRRADLTDATCVLHMMSDTGDFIEAEGTIIRNICAVKVPAEAYEKLTTYNATVRIRYGEVAYRYVTIAECTFVVEE